MRTRLAAAFIVAVTWFVGLVAATAPASAISCGGLNRKACGLTEGTRPCQGGLVVQGGRCTRPKKLPRTLTCGARNRRPCERAESPKACGRGLVLQKGKCVKPAPPEG